MLFRILSFLCLLTFSSLLSAQTFESGVSALPPGGDFSMSFHVDNGGYYSSVEEEEIVPAAPLPLTDPHYHPRGMHWVGMTSRNPLPRHAFIGGVEPNRNLYVCRGYYRDGVHPGKLVAGFCNIGWGGREVKLDHYEVLTSKRPLVWLSAGYGRVLANAVRGGDENGDRLYICQANYHGGIHIGKLLASNCNFGFGGKEIVLPRYRVLTAG